MKFHEISIFGETDFPAALPVKYQDLTPFGAKDGVLSKAFPQTTPGN